MKRFILAAVAVLLLSLVPSSAAAAAASAAPLVGDCDTNFPGYPLVPNCPDNQIRDAACFQAAQAAYLARWTDTVLPLVELRCELLDDIADFEAALAIFEDDHEYFENAIIFNQSLCDGGDQTACDLIPRLEDARDGAAIAIAQTEATIARLEDLLGRTEDLIFDVEAAAVTAYLAAAANCCSGGGQ